VRALLIRANRNEVDQKELAKLGIESIIDPYLEISQVPNSLGAERLFAALASDQPKWLVLTSTNALHFWSNLLPENALENLVRTSKSVKYAAIGEQTAEQLRAFGAPDVFRSSANDGVSLAEQLAATDPMPVVIPSGSIAMQDIPSALEANGFEIISEVVYQTDMVSDPPASTKLIEAGELDCVILRSPSSVRAFAKFNPASKLAAVCAGRSTAKEAERLGLFVAKVSPDPTPESVAKTTFEYLGRPR
jgi:uroporphyrinogen-III synthase